MPLLYKAQDGYNEDDIEALQAELATALGNYIEDCRIADTKVTTVDFAVYLLHVRAFIDGVAFIADEGPSSDDFGLL